jgi:hypothetical protein
MKLRQGNDPKRRIAPPDRLDLETRKALADKLLYVGSALHKRTPGDYGFHPPVNPRPWKSLCDGRRPILKAEAIQLFRQGIINGMFSDFPDNGSPKFVWSVDEYAEPYEAKIDSSGYHGYHLEDEDDMRALVLKEWRKRCPTG